MTNQTDYWIIAGLGEMLSFRSGALNQWRFLLDNYGREVNVDWIDSAFAEALKVERSTTDELKPIESTSEGAEDNRLVEHYWCSLLSCKPDHAGIRVSHIVNEDAINDQIAIQLNDHFSGRGLLFSNQQEGLMLSSREQLPAEWPSVIELINRNLFDFIGSALREVHWHALINEVQMLVAQDTWLQSKGINSIWLEPIPWWLYKHQNLALLNKNLSSLYQLETASVNAFLQYIPSEWEKSLAEQFNNILSWLRKNRFTNRKLIISDGKRGWQIKRRTRFLTSKFVNNSKDI